MRQPLGQHFLKTPGPAKALVASLEPSATDTVIEIGPGHGELTRYILQAPHANVIAVERDVVLAAGVVRRFEEDPSLKVVHADIREALSEVAAGLDASWKLAGNIPYYLTSHLIRQIGELKNPPARAALLMQREVAERIAAKPGSFSKLSAFAGAWSTSEIVLGVDRSAFSPPPKVDSAVLLLIRRDSPFQDREAYDAFVRIAFAQPRKMLANNLSVGDIPKQDILQLLEEVGMSAQARPHDLSVELIEKLSVRFAKMKRS